MTVDGQPADVIFVPPTPPITPLPTIPGWIPPLDTGQPPASELNALGRAPKQTFAARNTIIPIPYGRDRMFGKPIVIHVDEDTGFLYVAYGFGQGEIQGFETVFIDGIDVNDPDEGFLTNAGSVIELHVGTVSQTVSTLLSGVLTGYTDTNPNTAYIVIKAPQDSSQGFPKVEAIIQGRLVYDPRLDSTRTDITPVGSGAHRVADPTTWEFSTNPTLQFRDMVENFSGWEILDQGVVDSANFNDELIGGVKRREVGLTLAKPSLIDKWAKGFRCYMGAFLGWEDGKIRVVPNRSEEPVDIAMAIGVDDIVKDSIVLTRRSLRNSPNSVAVDYEDSSGVRWHTERVQTDSARVTSGDEQRRLSRVSLPGIHNASQAQREATERLNWYLTDLELKLTLFDPGWKLQNGSIVSVTHPIGLTGKLFRVRKLTALSGRWTVDLVEYDPAIYSTEVISDPTTPDTQLGNPLNPPVPSGLVLAEELFNYKNGLTGSRVRVTWDTTSFPFFSQYRVEGFVGGVLVWQTTTQNTNVVTPPVEEIVDALGTPTDYEVRVSTQSPFATSAAAIGNVQIDGKFAIPGDVPGVTVVQTAAGAVDIVWNSATDIDIWRYELRRGLTTDTWETATALGLPGSVLIDGLNHVETGLALGTHRYFVKAIDSVSQESTNEAFTDVTLIAPVAPITLNGFEVASEVRLNWPAAIGGFVQRYRVAFSDIPETFETTLDIVDTLRFQTKDVAEGTFTFKVFSLDAQGNESAIAATKDIEVTSDAESFLADSFTFINPTLINMVQYFLRLDSRQLYVTHMGDVLTSVSPSDFNNQSAVALANYHSSGASEWLSETKDFGVALTGSWNLTHDVTALQGAFDVALELSTDGIAFTSFGTAAKGVFQFARVRISTPASPGTATAFVKSPVMDLKVNVVPLEESGEGTTSSVAGVGSTQNLSREYTALKEIVAQPKNKTDALTAIVDNIVIGPNTGIQGDGVNFLSITDPAIFDFGATQDFSVEFLAKHSGGTATIVGLVDKREGGGSFIGWQITGNESSQEIEVTLDEGTNVITAQTTGNAFPNDGQWHHYAVTVNRATDEIRIYKDAVLNGASPHSIATITLTLANTGNFVVLARLTSSNPNPGAIDEVRIWDDIRTPAELLANKDIALDLTQTQANLIGYWLMDGPVGTSVGVIQDETINNNDLTNTGAGDLTFIDPGDNGNKIQKINSFDVFIFDIFGQQLAEQYQWKWKAV